MANATDVVGYSYDAAVHCVGCSVVNFDCNEQDLSTRKDSEGNEVHPIFNGEDAHEECECCQGSGKHEKKCSLGEYDCETCDGTGVTSVCCDDCGEELVS